MRNTWLMTWFTVREAMARKVFIAFMAISLLVIIIAAGVFSTMEIHTTLEGTPGGSNATFKEMVLPLEVMIITLLSSLGLLLAIFSCSSFVPIMLEKGNIDLLLSKPVSRAQLILGKYFGGVLVVLINLAFLISGVWLVISLKFSYWDFSFLYIIILITFAFAVLYALIVWFGVMTRSSTAGMMVAYFIFIILSPLLDQAKNQSDFLNKSDFLHNVITGLYYLVPKTSELMGKTAMEIASGKSIQDFQPVISSLVFLFLMLYLSITMFKRKDY